MAKSKSSRYWLRLILAFINRFKLIFLAGIIAGVFVFIFFVIFFPNLPKDTTRIGIVGEYQADNLPTNIAQMISSGLTSIDSSGKAISGIAKEWSPSDSGKTWTFKLRNDLYWQDGSPVTSADINYAFTDASITKPDKYTIIFKLNNAFAPFPVNVSRPIFKKGLLGIGQWKVVNLSLAGSYVDTLTLQNPENQRIVYRFYPTQDRAKLAYELGQVDELKDLIDPKPFGSWRIANIDEHINTHRVVAIFFNTTDSLTGDKDFRQALGYAIDKPSLLSFAGKTKRALGPISIDSWAYNPSIKPYDFDLDHAKELISNAKIDPAAKKDLKIKLTTIPELLPEADLVAKNWNDVGVKTTLQVTSYVPQDFQAYLAIYDIPNDPDQYLMWHHTQTQTNVTKYSNTRIDKLLEDGRLETDETKRKAIYFDFQKFLEEDSPAAFLYYPNYYDVSRK